MKRLIILRIVPIGLACLFSFSICWAQDQRDQKFKESYSLGYEFGSSLKMRGLDSDIDTDVLLSAVREGLEGKTSVLSTVEVRETLSELKRKVLIMQDRRFREMAAKNLEDSKAFLESNRSKEGVKELKVGLQYRVIAEGHGAVPKPSDIVKINYRGTLTDGTEVESSEGREGPLIGRADGMMKGWTEALQLMKEGSKWQVFVPPWLGYGEKKFRRIPPNSVLVYEIELLSVGVTPGAMADELKPVADALTAKDKSRREGDHSD